ncbi:Enoyl-CoA hydratase [Lentibacillus sp. JNUCC-1]|uniref:enoyl-CoA hydratase-related protein n=1 Tax=Lentibacillus sp. JNUCC-1 TaxID=2654513 RepID=UPI0012E8D05F|nr:enoyl-CoA hydratase-related protein [Lentibacillus sp. JNUCC-1]MUV37544.1 Enoyl-CoA hydratase [Lentibacillus sp. JNUCC-1]
MPEFIQVSVTDHVGIVTLNRLEVLNALNRQMITEIAAQLEAFDKDPAIRVMVINGAGRAFAAGADIDEMMTETPLSMERADPFADWDRLRRIKKPIIASVHGFALGGGFELVLHCDLIMAAETAEFGFPEVKLGVMPGAGGTQLLTRAMGRRKALAYILLGDTMTAQEAAHFGVVDRMVAEEMLHEETIRLARQLTKQPPLSVRLIKETVLRAEDLNLDDGLLLERKNFYMLFDSHDQKEGMQAFQEKRKPEFKGE